MPFKTKLDLSNNRQVTQHVRTTTQLSGITQFGVSFSALTTGPNLTTTGVTSSYIPSTDSTFSGTTGSTIFNWVDSVMVLGYDKLVPITPSNSGITQYTYGFLPSNTIIIDGNTVNTTYTGVSYDLVVTSFKNLDGYNYSGTVKTNKITYLTADALDFQWRNIWVDVNGITRTKSLIVTNGIEQSGVMVKTKIINLGTWDINNTTSLSITHGLGVLFTGITSIIVTIIDNSNSTITDFNNHSGNYYEVNSTNIILTKGSTYYNNTNYDGTVNNRGYLTITYKG